MARPELAIPDSHAGCAVTLAGFAAAGVAGHFGGIVAFAVVALAAFVWGSSIGPNCRCGACRNPLPKRGLQACVTCGAPCGEEPGSAEQPVGTDDSLLYSFAKHLMFPEKPVAADAERERAIRARKDRLPRVSRRYDVVRAGGNLVLAIGSGVALLVFLDSGWGTWGNILIILGFYTFMETVGQFRCSECRHPVAYRDVRKCPSCGKALASFYRPSDEAIGG